MAKGGIQRERCNASGHPVQEGPNPDLKDRVDASRREPAVKTVAQERLNYTHFLSILMHMRTTLIIDQNLLERARQLTGIRKKTALVRAGLEALIAREAARRLAALAGAEPRLRAVPRRRPGASR
jgi:hypothetical protein